MYATTKSDIINYSYNSIKQAIQNPAVAKSSFLRHQCSTPVKDKNAFKQLVQSSFNRCNYYTYPGLVQQEVVLYQSHPKSGKLLLGELHQLKTNAVTCCVKTIIFELVAITPRNLPEDTETKHVIRTVLYAEVKPTLVIDLCIDDDCDDVADDNENSKAESPIHNTRSASGATIDDCTTSEVSIGNGRSANEQPKSKQSNLVLDLRNIDDDKLYTNTFKQAKAKQNSTVDNVHKREWALSPTPYFKTTPSLSSTSSGIIGNLGTRISPTSSRKIPTFDLIPNIGTKSKRASTKGSRKSRKFDTSI